MPNTEIGIARKPNSLASQKSPYLLQHALNPVNWHAWGEEAFEKAKDEDKPIFLSIGYATCHWCHVMAHESFEDEEVATYLNKSFISIKVDREERPDVDKIYMSACQALTGHGGWPLSVFMTADAKPFFAGTYFPKSRRMGIPGFLEIINAIAQMWKNDRARLIGAGENIINAIKERPEKSSPANPSGIETLQKGYTQLEKSYDDKWGGFGKAPKFPTPHLINFLLRWSKRRPDSRAKEMVDKTLKAMRRGGVFDQIGFGFHRYSVDEKWLVPHFEKMLYDQALLAIAYIEAYQFTRDAEFEGVAKEIFSYVLGEMTSKEGAFFSAEDADSEGKEGLFYLWSRDEIKKLLGEDREDLFCRFFDIRKEGNFEAGRNILNTPMSMEKFAEKEGLDPIALREKMEESRETVKRIRDKRVHPLKDDKILTSWNGLMIAALSKGFKVFGNNEYYAAAKRSADFILKSLRMEGNRLLRRFREGEAAYTAYLDDYAFLVWGLIELYEANFDVGYLEEAIALNSTMTEIFWDQKSGGLYFTGDGNENLIIRTKDIYDGALPSGNSVAALNFLRLGRITGSPALEEMSEKILSHFYSEIELHPAAHTQLLNAIDFKIGPGVEIVVAGDRLDKETILMINAIRNRFIPGMVLLLRPDGPEGERIVAIAPYLKSMVQLNGKPAVYVCRNYACLNPVTELDRLEEILDSIYK